MLNNHVPSHVLPTTGRDAETLARRHGYKNLASLAQSLPPNAAVLDLGAGASSLGKEAARLRPDVHWINLDFSYHDTRILAEAKKGAPSNLTVVAGDATKLDEFLKAGSIDAVFSYWLFPHLSTYNQQSALTAAEQVYTVTKQGGILAVGPRRQPWFHPACILGKSWRVTKDGQLTIKTYSCEVLRQTQLSALNRSIRRAFNAAAFETFRTSRYFRGRGIISQQVYNPVTKTYIPLYTLGAMALVSKMYIRTAAKIISRPRLRS